METRKPVGKIPSRSIKSTVFSSAQTPQGQQQTIEGIVHSNFAETSQAVAGALSNLNRKVKPLATGNMMNNSSIQSYVDQSLLQFTSNKQETNPHQKVRLIN